VHAEDDLQAGATAATPPTVTVASPALAAAGPPN
jgi:hypothetical protein